MAEKKGALIAKTVQKHAGRAKEKILQNLGKVDKTADDIFDEHLVNFWRQQTSAMKLKREFHEYLRCIRAVQAASKTFMDSLNEIYESQWTGHDILYVQAQNLDMLWQDYSNKLTYEVLVPFTTYQSQFCEMKKKVEKRGRKLVDYDSQRHNFQSLQCNPKKRDELKVSRGKELLKEAKRTYEQLNSELHDELPALYDSRVLFLVTNLQTFFAAEQVFHNESAKVYSELEAIVDKLANESQRGTYSTKKNTQPQSPKSQEQISPNASLTNKTQPAQNNISTALDDTEQAARDTSPTTQLNGNANSNANSNDNSLNKQDTSPQNTVAPSKQVEELYDIPVGASTDNLPPGVLYRVKATYKYSREDVDELSFDVGEIIRVVEYDDPEEQEEGWLMGMKEGTDEKGMFPANFTKPL